MGNFSQIIEETDFEFLSVLDQHLSFVVPGAQYTKAFRGWQDKKGNFQRWDGTRKIMTSTLVFPTGLIPRIENFFRDHHKKLDIVDERESFGPATPIDIEARLKQLNKVPYPYQVDAVVEAKKHERGIIKLATGGGKSLIAAMLAAAYGKKTIIYVIGKDLLYQFHDLFTSIFGKKVGLIGDGQCTIGDINIASIWTVGKAFGMKNAEILLDSDDGETELKGRDEEIQKLVADAKLHIIDECHMAACETIQSIYKTFDSAERIYGLSGSPWRDDNADLLIEGILGRYIVDIPASYLIARDFLAKPIIKFVAVPALDEPPPNNYQSTYKAYVVENPQRNALVVKAAKAIVAQGYQTLVLFNSLAHGEILYNLLKDEIPCEILNGSNDQKTRDSVKERLASGELKCVLASKIFDIGVDIPSLSGLVVACGGKSTVKAIQRIGRVIRKYPGKKVAAIVDFADNVKFLDKHSKIRKKIYESEDGFEVTWVKRKRRK
jgi:superfamily II DNA or RNA helicase